MERSGLETEKITPYAFRRTKIDKRRSQLKAERQKCADRFSGLHIFAEGKGWRADLEFPARQPRISSMAFKTFSIMASVPIVMRRKRSVRGLSK